MITIECHCAHHEDDLKAIVMLAIAGLVAPPTWIPCLSCSRIAFLVEDRPRLPWEVALALVEGGVR